MNSRDLITILVVFSQFLCMAAKGNHSCSPSSCGNLRNISYPFRLKTDPRRCGDFRYELACENNNSLPVLYLFSGKYYVQTINYRNYTIRVVDPDLIRSDNWSSSLPLYPLGNYNFTGYNTYPPPYTIHKNQGPWYSKEYVAQTLIFVSCLNPVNSKRYVRMAPRGFDGAPYSYVLAGYVTAGDLVESCRVESMAMTSLSLLTVRANWSFGDVINEMAFGFELSWFNVRCKAPHSWCYIDFCYLDESNIVQTTYYCFGFFSTLPPLALSARAACGMPCICAFFIYKWRRRHLSGYNIIEDFIQNHNNLVPIRYSYSEIKKMTRGFEDKLGEGGFGCVFQGKLRSGGLVAVKMLNTKGHDQDFISEVATIGRVYHTNVVQLVGFCADGPKRALVYDFMPKGSLDKYIFAQEGSIILSWEKLYQISLGIARGMDYLHRGCDIQILHFDIKPHNVLLDNNFIPKISDFGLARLFPTENKTIYLTAARGTLGYMAPELFYKNIGSVSYKADVYSFGMLLLEIAGRRKNVNAYTVHSSKIYFPRWVYDQLSKGKEIEMGDATEVEKGLVKKMVIIALWCIQMKPNDRPSMSKVVKMLEGDVELLQMPPKPVFYPQEIPVEDCEMDTNAASSSYSDSDSISLLVKED
ncbi:Wall-associated receptor kinase, galacturonan-binding domain [Dillenia turbinata]|uniref:Wall-associated receptor kinase, galacturonan-binding domain n=1 Tax=Dillenia turbinata TaxID=194707 RepID=A0AAN8V1Q0_9MAGN